jgi:hypothetical protein
MGARNPALHCGSQPVSARINPPCGQRFARAFARARRTIRSAPLKSPSAEFAISQESAKNAQVALPAFVVAA